MGSTLQVRFEGAYASSSNPSTACIPADPHSSSHSRPSPIPSCRKQFFRCSVLLCRRGIALSSVKVKRLVGRPLVDLRFATSHLNLLTRLFLAERSVKAGRLSEVIHHTYSKRRNADAPHRSNSEQSERDREQPADSGTVGEHGEHGHCEEEEEADKDEDGGDADECEEDEETDEEVDFS